MIIYVGIIFLMSFVNCRIRIRGYFDDYLSKENCNAIKGIFILLIIASHFTKYVEPYTAPIDIMYRTFRSYLGQGVVALFLFYSGYGIFLQKINKGIEYVEGIPRKRILPTYVIFLISQIPFLLLESYLGTTYNLKKIVYVLLVRGSFGNDNWYIFVKLVLYFISYLSFRIFPNSDKAAVIALSLGTIVFGVILYIEFSGGSRWWYNTVLCYPVGAWYALYKDSINHFVKKNRIHYVFMLGISVIMFLSSHEYSSKNMFRLASAENMSNVALALIIVFASMKIQINNRLLRYCGEHLQGLFLTHRLPMIFFKTEIFNITDNIYIYFIVCLMCTFLLELIFDRFVSYMRTQMG